MVFLSVRMKTDTPALKQRNPDEIETSARLHLEWFVCSEHIVRSERLKEIVARLALLFVTGRCVSLLYE